ncbi:MULTISPECIES: lysophospholipid acyltransferase family protein [Maribacter]|uniref:Lysophospholipid acyltransferase family protein n=1 Tax=Maribacter flavus TaxID=1658664 RepID=A0ABU7II21_9FLAO|nr:MULTISPECIES: lysophospholipid acyltransferase family protein [Maribacter]MDC6405096.1 lysophospholipid acyltransferase family protein [Maribacter sp. PR66]MEE1972509.1 lysophospholipid acyltransferase family protein [Maribacter flavus]
MKNLLYNLVKVYIKTGLHSYHKKIVVFGLENVPLDKPVMFLPNHQSALMDVLLIAVDCNRKPYFLTRADVFGKPLLNKIFKFFQMIPVYRIRDGRSSLSKNNEVFDKCSQILGQGKALVMFPEANHNLKRRVRPLSKGFTRIVFRALQQHPEIDLQIVPVGLNYLDATGFPDSVAVYYGTSISARSLFEEADIQRSEKRTKSAVSNALKKLTTHIASEEDYDTILEYLASKKISFLRPRKVNQEVSKFELTVIPSGQTSISKQRLNIFKVLIALINFPMWLLWKFIVKPKVWEAEFTGTLRYATAQVGFTVYFLVLFLVISFLVNVKLGLLIVGGIFLLNRILVKFA